MSKIGQQPINIPADISVNITGETITLSGKKGVIVIPSFQDVKVEVNDNVLTCSLIKETNQARSNWGTFRSLIANGIEGLTNGFKKKLLLDGVGYKIAKEGTTLVMSLGFSHPIRYELPEGITVEIEKNSILTVIGNDKQRVGQVSAEIRSLKKPEPYKGTGFRYSDEIIRRKAGKKATTTAK